MNTKNIPVIIMLLAGLVASIVTFRIHYELHSMLWILLGVLLGFYIFGVIIKLILDRCCAVKGETENTLPTNEDGTVIEKADTGQSK